MRLRRATVIDGAERAGLRTAAAIRANGSEAPGADDAQDDDASLAVIASVCDRIAEGDLEVRVPILPGGPTVMTIRTAVNRLADVVDAYVRESRAVLTAADQGRFHRRFLLRGMPGAFREGAQRIDEGRASLAAAAAAANAESDRRTQLAVRLVDVAEQVAQAAEDLAESAAVLAQASHDAAEAALGSLPTVGALEHSAEEIQTAVRLIQSIAGKTRLLALNATIEAAHAGEAGRGFAVVAHEVRTLADDSAASSEGITLQVDATQRASADAAAAFQHINGLVSGMSEQVQRIASAAGGAGAGTGLAHLALQLRAEVEEFAGLGAGGRAGGTDV